MHALYCMLCGARYAISDCHVINVHVYNRSNLITRTSVGYHNNKQALHIILGQAHYTPYGISCSTRDLRMYLLLDISILHTSPLHL